MMTPKLLLDHAKNEICKTCFFFVAARKDWPCELDLCPNRKGECVEFKQDRRVIISNKPCLIAAPVN